MTNPVAAGLSKISLLNYTNRQAVETQIVLEVYDGENRIQVEFNDLDHVEEVSSRDPQAMIDYFESNLFDSPDMDDPEDALLKMASVAGDEGLVTVPPEGDDEQLFDLMTRIFQKTAELNENKQGKTNGSTTAGEDFLQSLVRENEENN